MDPGRWQVRYLALERTARNLPEAQITVIDTDGRLRKKISPGTVFIKDDGISWLFQSLERDSDVDLIIPAVPVHVAAQWLKMTGAGDHKVSPAPIPEQVVKNSLTPW